MNRAAVRLHAAVGIALSATLALSVAGCRSTGGEVVQVDVGEAIKRLNRPLSGDPAALYRVRVSSSGGLRLALLTSGGGGRLTVSEPFGSAVSLTAWSGDEPPTFFDLREGCRLEASDLELVLGVAAMPLPQAVRLMAGRLPAADEDGVTAREDGKVAIDGTGWRALVTVRAEPWRVVSVEDVGNADAGWRIDLSDHSLSVPGSIRVENRAGRWAVLELVRLEWNDGADLPGLPELPVCTIEHDR